MKIFSKISTAMWFLIFVAFLYLICAIFNHNLCVGALTNFLNLLKNVLPVLLIVFVLMFFSNLLLKTEKIIKYLGHDSGVSGFLISIIFGILSAGPIYMWYPLLADFKEKGMKDSLIATFLYNRAIKLQLLPIMIYYFGLKFVMVLSIYMIIFSVINGISVGKFLTQKK